MIPKETYEGGMAAGWDEMLSHLAGKLYDWHDADAPGDTEQWGEE